MGCRIKLPESVVAMGLTAEARAHRQQMIQRKIKRKKAERCTACKKCGENGIVIRNLHGDQLCCDVIQCRRPTCRARCCAECGQETTVNHQCPDREKYNKWIELLKVSTPCPRCRRFVERISGCNQMTCKCGTFFCYACGSAGSTCGNGPLYRLRTRPPAPNNQPVPNIQYAQVHQPVRYNQPDDFFNRPAVNNRPADFFYRPAANNRPAQLQRRPTAFTSTACAAMTVIIIAGACRALQAICQ